MTKEHGHSVFSRMPRSERCRYPERKTFDGDRARLQLISGRAASCSATAFVLNGREGMQINPRQFSAPSTALALSDLRLSNTETARLLADVLSGHGVEVAATCHHCAHQQELSHWDEWTKSVRMQYASPIGRFKARLRKLHAETANYRPLASTVLAVSGIGIAFIIHLGLERFAR